MRPVHTVTLTNTEVQNVPRYLMLPAEGSFEDVEVIMADTIRLFAKETVQQLPPIHPSLMLILSLRQTGSMVQMIYKRPCTLQCWLKQIVCRHASSLIVGQVAHTSVQICSTNSTLRCADLQAEWLNECMGQWTNELRHTMSMLNQMSLIVLD